MRKLYLQILIFFFFIAPGFCAESSPSYKAAVERILSNHPSATTARHSSFKECLFLLEQKKAKTWIETGSSGNFFANKKNEAGSTILFAKAAYLLDADFYSVDINKEVIKNAKQAVKKYKKAVFFSQSDSLLFLRKFQDPIDFLYLDTGEYDSSRPEISQNQILAEIRTAYPKLHKNSIVMINDCGFPQGGKGKLAIEYLKQKGWKVHLDEFQVILVKN